jgi:hypothetical protein
MHNTAVTKCVIGKCEKYTELERAQWWFVGWNRLVYCPYYRVRNGQLKAISRLFVSLRGQSKEGGGK